MAAGGRDPPPRVPDFYRVHPQASKTSIANKSLGTGSPGDRRQSRVPKARPRTGPAARSRSVSSSLGTAGDPRADAQTDRRRGAGRSPAAPGSAKSKEGRANSSYPLTLLCRPALL